MASQQPNLKAAAKYLPPPLTPDRHKGQAGRIGIIGGSPEYTGAPYFAGMTALRCGADLVYVFCAKDAAGPIKSYAPELIVLPFLDEERAYELIVPRLTNLHALVIGPGLGVNEQIYSLVLSLIRFIEENEPLRSKLSLVFDADSINLLTREKQILLDYQAPVYVTPNINELRKLKKAYFEVEVPDELDDEVLHSLVQRVNANATIIVKGCRDKIVTSSSAYDCDVVGSSRRVGGQGDLLSGSLGVFSYWANLHHGAKINGISPEIVAAYSACAITRLCNQFAYRKKGRSMITSDMVDEVQNAFETCFEL